MYTCLIADDHIVERDLIKVFIQKIPTLQLVAECANGLEISGALNQQNIDFVFSDVDMPELSGIDLLKTLKNPPIFIFISSYPEYAAEGFNLDIVDFMTKPLKFERFQQGVNKAIEYLELKRSAANNDSAAELTTDTNRQFIAGDFFFIKEGLNYVKVNTKEVLYIESMGDFSKIHTIQQKSFIVLIGMKNLESQLSAKSFLRVHKQYIINLSHLEALKQNDLLLTGNQSIPLSNTYKQILLDSMINQHLLKRF